MPAEVEFDGIAAGPDVAWLHHVVDTVLAAEIGRAALVSVTICDDTMIARVNQEHLGHLGPTDVITFPLADHQTAAAGRLAADMPLGVVLISGETAAAQAADFDDWADDDEITLLLIHGVLHLCGWDDADDEQRKAMARREDEMLRLLGRRAAPR